MKIDQLIKKETKLVQELQAAEQVLFKKHFLESGMTRKAVEAIKKESYDFAERLVNQSVKYGMQWLKGSNK
jgi:hypothetical protein